MADRPDLSTWDPDRPALATLAIVAVTLAALVALPYVQYILLGVVLAYVLMPAQRRLEQYVGSMIAAGVLVAVAVLVILLPVAYVLAIAFREALELVSAFQEGDLNVAALEERLETTGYQVDLSETYETFQDPITTGVQGLATSGLEIVGGLPGILIGVTVTLFVLFALLRDGDRLIGWICESVAIDNAILQELLEDFDQLMWASVVGNVAVAMVQAAALGVGLVVLDVPAVVFLVVVTFVFALLPLIGAFGVWLPVSVYLAATGNFVAAAGLVVYGSVVSASDTYLRPALIGRTSAFNSAIIVVGIFGGIVVFGAVGLFIGPVVLGGAKITVDIYARERDRQEHERVDEDEADPVSSPEDGPVEPAEEPTEESEPDVESDGANASPDPDAS